MEGESRDERGKDPRKRKKARYKMGRGEGSRGEICRDGDPKKGGNSLRKKSGEVLAKAI